MFDTIAAISSGLVNQPVSIIRISGSEAFNIAKKIFSGKVGKDKTITYGYIVEGKTKIDEVLVSWFKGSNTFTGEDVVEINAHGGVVNSNKILKMILANGARLAERGEFSRRAFLNGKMDLLKAEAIHDLIFAKTEEQALMSAKKFDGKTSKLINTLQTRIEKIIAICETNIDYPEYDDVETLTSESLLPQLNNVESKIKEILDSSKSSRYVFEGINVAIVGKPNAGKSSLLNALLREDKAIVTSVPGTTRDIVEGKMQVGQVLLNLKDTAGIHSTSDKIEKIGIQKSLNQIKDADLVIHLVDSTQPFSEIDGEIQEASKNKAYLLVFNKNDIANEKHGISISAKNGDITKLIDAIKDIYKDIDLESDKIINNSRQLALIESARNSINEAIKGLKNGIMPDTVIIDIRNAWESLANILGRAAQEDLLDSMFSNFCLGK